MAKMEDKPTNILDDTVKSSICISSGALLALFLAIYSRPQDGLITRRTLLAIPLGSIISSILLLLYISSTNLRDSGKDSGIDKTTKDPTATTSKLMTDYNVPRRSIPHP
ncbi:MAG: hypothetical protein KBD64_05745 [Gammaproteobacteria bacterium]|nr:hypothetical protein [Gammaproteobacteria bacterium]